MSQDSYQIQKATVTPCITESKSIVLGHSSQASPPSPSSCGPFHQAEAIQQQPHNAKLAARSTVSHPEFQ